MTTEYRKWWDFFQNGNNQHDSFIKWFSEHQDELPSTITSMISVGAGYGDLDSYVINNCLKGLKSYIGVEPDFDNRETLNITMPTQCPNIKVVSDPIGVWQGPAEPVDLILAIQVVYYFQDKVPALKQFYSWLRPGGVLIIGHSYDNTMYAGVANEAGLDGDYWMSHLKEDVKQAGLTDFKEYKMPYNVDHGSTFKEDMVKYYYKHNTFKGAASDADVQMCTDIFKKRFLERIGQQQTYHNGIILLKKLP